MICCNSLLINKLQFNCNKVFKNLAHTGIRMGVGLSFKIFNVMDWVHIHWSWGDIRLFNILLDGIVWNRDNSQ